MTLSGLLDAVLPDPALARAVSSAGVASLDLAAPPALRPLVAAALAADPARGGAGRPVLAVTATGRDAGELAPVAARAGDVVELDDLVERLSGVGYTRVELVEKRGEFAVRGGILDVFPPTEEHPVRVEFWGDDVEEVRYFTVADQRSSGPAEHGLWAPPCRELLLIPPVRERAKQLAAEHPELAEMLDKLADGTAVEGMEALAPVLVDELRLVLHELPAGTHVLVCDPERVRTRAAELVRTSEEFLDASWAAAAGGGTAPIDLGAAALRTVEQAREDAAELGIPWWTLSPFAADVSLGESDVLAVDAAPAE